MTRLRPACLPLLLLAACGPEASDTIGASEATAQTQAAFAAELIAEVTPATTSVNDWFGDAVSADGDRVLVGRPLDDYAGLTDPGTAFIYERQADGSWMQIVQMQPSLPTSSGFFGRAVAIRGDTAVVGAWGEGTALRGAVYVYSVDPVTGNWGLQQRLVASDGAAFDYFGFAVAIDGDVIAASAINRDQGGTNAGGVYLFKRSNGAWAQTAIVTPPNAAGYHYFGRGLDLEGNQLVVGAPRGQGAATTQGDAHVFTSADGGSSWSYVQELSPSNPGSNDRFGYEVALSGTTALVSAPDNGGQVYAFTEQGGQWVQEAILSSPLNGSAADFGTELTLRGDVAAIGAPLADQAAPNAGAVHVFRRMGTTWTEEDLFTPPALASGDRFGASVALNDGGLVAGAQRRDNPSTDGGSVFFARLGGELGDACALDDECLSGFCVDGLCCDSACDEGCASCGLAGLEGTCSPEPSSTVCRAAADGCDAEELCDGQILTCPQDLAAADGTLCDGGICEAGICIDPGTGGGGMGGMATGGAGGSISSNGGGGSSSDGGASAAGGSSPTPGGPSGPGSPGGSGGSDGGCSVSALGGPSGLGGAWLLMACGLLANRRRRRG